MSVAVIDYGSGNLRSAAKALERAARDRGLGMEVVVTSEPDVVRKADRVVLPGVGAFADCRRGLDALSGMMDAVQEAAMVQAKPFLGICVGMQLMASVGREHRDTAGFDWIAGEVVALCPADRALKIPHMGWNELVIDRPDHPVLGGLAEGTHVYFVHSYHLLPKDPALRLARVDYGGSVTAVVGRDNIIGTQFHPEKSQAAGLHLLGNFLEWKP
ncbi:imidazole glycerol phosphate synthase subunit HisH [Limibacillus sp. MBR-115]|uniref:imidazole glycerol phosphate synthase subunit HisH n=1 Tax=Limibacillus sp. MBR-115 TaxID=3156465 RepID=UPI0033991558